MKLLKILFAILVAFFLSLSIASAGDFDWMQDFNIRAEADPSGLRAGLEARFQVGGIEINTVLGNVEKPADAYMLLRLGEISNLPIANVIERYKEEKEKGWGALAQSLGIKPGSSEFKALKEGQDLYSDKSAEKGNTKSKGKSKGGK